MQPLDTTRLGEWMAGNVEGYAGPLTAEKFAGGQSNPTFRLRTPHRDYVLRRQPSGPLLKGAHAVDREFRVTSALHEAGFPVARPWAFCADETIIGTMFYIMDLVEGRIFWDASLPEISRAERPAYFDAMNGTIAALHRLDPAALGLADYGRASNYVERQVRRWAKQYQEDELAGRIEAMDRLIAWFPGNIPASDEAAISHGDFRCDNMIFHAREPRVIAVLDWELSTIGHPIADFAYHLMMFRLPPSVQGGLKGKDLAALNIPSETEYAAAYCRRTGRQVLPDLDFYIAFNMFRFAAIIHGIRGRMARGNASNAEAAKLAEAADPLAEQAWAIVQTLPTSNHGVPK